MNTIEKPEKELTGKHVLAMLLVFFGVMLCVNIFFTVMAVQSFSGEDVPRSYRQGLEYNRTLHSRAVQNALGWSAHVNALDEKLFVEFRDRDGERLSNLGLTGVLRHPATLSNDQILQFEQTANGRFEAKIFGLKGKWVLKGEATSENEIFQFEYELWLQ